MLLLQEPLGNLPVLPVPAACPIPARRQHLPEQRLFFQPGWRRWFLSLPKFQAFYSPPPAPFFFLGFKNKNTMFLLSRAGRVALVKTLPQFTEIATE